MTLSEYQIKAAQTAIYPDNWSIVYPALGLAGEAGEVANKVKKLVRDGKLDKEAVAAELGDVLWYLSALARDLDADLGDIAQANINKLESRMKRGVIGGSGDTR